VFKVKTKKITKMKRLIFCSVLFLVFSIVSVAQTQKVLNVGDKAPSFKTLADDGSTWDVNNFIGKKYIVVYFYPAAMTGGCTKQACAYRDMQTEISSADAIVVGVSGDNVEGLKLFKKVENLNFTLLSDETGEIAKSFGVPIRDGGKITREIDGQSYDLVRGVSASRWTFIIDKNGKIAYKNEQVNAEKDTQEVLNFIKNI
jgi:peroxiredoxin Q/BCP